MRARIYTPDNLRGGAPLVVVLHGCTQTAADYEEDLWGNLQRLLDRAKSGT